MNTNPSGKARLLTGYKPDMRKLLWQTLLAPLKIPNMIWSPVGIEWATYRQSKFTRSRFSQRLLRELLKAGWYEGRKIPRDAIAKMYGEPVDFFSVPAMEILEEFGGLRIGRHGAFLTSYQSGDVEATVSGLLGSTLCPFGRTTFYCDTSGLWVDERGRIFVTNGTNDYSKSSMMTLEYVAGNFVDALEFLAAGAKAPAWPASTTNKEGVWSFKDES